MENAPILGTLRAFLLLVMNYHDSHGKSFTKVFKQRITLD